LHNIGIQGTLNGITKARSENAPIAVSSASLDGGSSSLLWIDMLVWSESCVGACVAASQAFTDLCLMGDDLDGKFPRYLLRAMKSPFRAQRIAEHETCWMLEAAIQVQGVSRRHGFFHAAIDAERSDPLLAAVKGTN
jgi:hypothetical protein